MAQYVLASHVRAAAISSGKEKERDVDLSYIVQSGPLKNLSVTLRMVASVWTADLLTTLTKTELLLGIPLASGSFNSSLHAGETAFRIANENGLPAIVCRPLFHCAPVANETIFNMRSTLRNLVGMITTYPRRTVRCRAP